MEKNGLTLSDKFLVKLSHAQAYHKALIETSIMKNYNDSLIEATEDLKMALKDNDCSTMLQLEKIAQEQDLSRIAIDQEKKAQALTMLISIQETYEKGKNPEYAKNLYDKAYSNVEKKPKEFIDKQMETSIKSVCSSLRELSRGLSNVPEHVYYVKRIECLNAVKKEHNNNINKALGFQKEKKKGLER